MRMKRLAACVAILACLTAPAWGSDWNVGNGLWGNGANWLPAGVPTGTNANIANGGSATLQTAVPAITTFDLTGGSDLTINTGANLTTTGNAVIATGAFNDGYVAHNDGTLSFGADLILGNGASTYGEWIMSTGSVEVANNMTVGSGGDGVFSMADGGLTVHGGLAIADSSGLGTMTVTGGTLLQDGVAASLNVGGSGAGTLRVEGDTSTINVTNYEQGVIGSLDLVMNDFGITTINATGDMALSGVLNVTIAAGSSPAAGVYDILVAEGDRTGQFLLASLPVSQDFALRYEEVGTDSVVRLYVDTEPPALTNSTVSFRDGDGSAVIDGARTVQSGVWVNGASVGPYAGTQDTWLTGWLGGGGNNQGGDSNNWAWSKQINPQLQEAQALLMFNDIFVDLGANPTQAAIDAAVAAGQIPMGSTIDYAYFEVRNWNNTDGGTGPGNTGLIGQILEPTAGGAWNEGAVGWNDWGAGGFILGDGTSNTDTGVTVPGDGPGNWNTSADLAASLQSMSDGASANYGWCIIPTGGTSHGDPIGTCTRILSAEHGSLGARPGLVVNFTAPTAGEPPVNPVPEPTGLGLIGLALLAARRRRS